jgi:hypothetical protein
MKTICHLSMMLCLLLLPSCAHTTLYDGSTGHRLAHFEGDMTGVTYSRAADGSVQMSGTILHSPATLAQGKAIAGTAVVASGLVTLVSP